MMYGFILRGNKLNLNLRIRKMKIYKNDVLVLEIDDYGLLKKRFLQRKRYEENRYCKKNYGGKYNKKLFHL